MNKLINYLFKEKILEQPATFDDPKFREKILQDTSIDKSIKNNVFEVIDNGFTVVKKSVSNLLIDEAIVAFYSWKNRNKENLTSFYKYDEMLDRIIGIQNTRQFLISYLL